MATYHRPATDFENSVFKFLNQQLHTKEVSVSVVMKHYQGLSKRDAECFIELWNFNYNSDGDYERIIVEDEIKKEIVQV